MWFRCFQERFTCPVILPSQLACKMSRLKARAEAFRVKCRKQKPWPLRSLD